MAGAVPATGESMSVRDIKAAHRAFAEAAVRHDLEGVASVFASDAIIMPPDAEMVKGRDAILRHWKGAFDGGLSGLKINPTRIDVIGDVAIEIGHATLSMSRPVRPQPRPTSSTSRSGRRSVATGGSIAACGTPAAQPSPDISVRPNGAVHQWRKEPPRKLSVGPGS